MFERFSGLLGIVLILAIAFLLSNNRRAINYRVVGTGLLLQLLLALFILKVPVGQAIFAKIGQAITKLLAFSDKGAEFVFGALVKKDSMDLAFGKGNDFIFFFKIIPTIIFVSILVSVAYHVGIMQRVVSAFAKGVHKLMGVSGSEAVSNVASVFVGQVEAQIMIKPYLQGMTKSELLASMSGSMACIAGGVMAVYIALGVPANYLLAASLMAAPGALAISKIIFPETEPSETRGHLKLDVKREHINLIDSISHGASDGLKVGLNVVAMLIGFIALIAVVDYLLGFLGQGMQTAGFTSMLVFFGGIINLKNILGGFFSVIAWTMGVPEKDMHVAGALMGQKMVINEFVAYLDMVKLKDQLAPKTLVITSFALCGFANFSSIAIQVGGIGQLAPARRQDLAALGVKALICGTLASYLSATLAGIIM